MLNIALVSGGTGGHIFPAMALEKELKKNEMVKKITFLATATSLSEWVLEKEKKDVIFISLHGFIGKSFHKKILAVFYAAAGILRSLMLIRKELPDVACGFGGYGAFPFLAACCMRRIPFILHEQNLIPGRATSILSRFAKDVLISFPDSKNLIPSKKTFFTGNLCREDFIHYYRSLNNSGYEPENKNSILVVGGSQGSRFLNKNLPKILLNVLDEFPELRIIHIAGTNEKELVNDAYGPKNARVTVMDFSLDMLELFKQARLVISRAGATILSEICLCGIPSILIPFAASADNHQYHNALWFRERGAALMIEEKNFTEDFFYATAMDLLSSTLELKKISSALLKLARPDAAKLAAERILKCYAQA